MSAYIKKFKKAFLSTDISVTLKVHLLIQHTKQCLELLGNNVGLGIWSEQAGEAIHREFLKHWDRYKVKSLDYIDVGIWRSSQGSR